MRCFVLLAFFAAALAAPTEEECENMAEKCFEAISEAEKVNKDSCEALNKIPDCLETVINKCAESNEEKAEAEGLIRQFTAAAEIMCGEPCAKPDDILPALSVCIETLEEVGEMIFDKDEEEDNSIDIDVSEADAQCILGAFLTECAGEVIEFICGDLIAEAVKEGMMEALVEEGVGRASELCEIPKDEKMKRHVMKTAIKKSTVFKRFAKHRRSTRK